MSYHTAQSGKSTSNEEISQYLQDLARMPVLTLKAEQKVIQQIAAAPDSAEANAARTLLIEANLRMVVRLARCYQPFGPELADLVQEGNLALTRAAQKFAPQPGQRFGPFASRAVCWGLLRLVIDHLREKHLWEADAATEPLHPLSARVHKALLRNAIDEQALVFDLPEERFISLDILLAEIETDACLSDDRSFDHTFCRDESNESAPDERSLAQERREVIAACLRQLTKKERLVLTHRFLLDGPQTLEGAGRTLRMTRELVRLTELRGLRKLRHPHFSKILCSLL
jgi:RNA polymerase sigma factor (sigma-70 family)